MLKKDFSVKFHGIKHAQFCVLFLRWGLLVLLCDGYKQSSVFVFGLIRLSECDAKDEQFLNVLII